ncbi:hypothetical protein CRUP_037323 [Coryphaenoides rupestris]|nr:hypothetical protein CRUP_037323 [Coryphaenoides rupestris]
MSLSIPTPPNKMKKLNRIITDLSNISQNDDEMDPEASEFDLGTKIKTPKDVMLEELTALPFGGYDKASRLMTFELPDVNTVVEEPEPLSSLTADMRSRPSFNRTPIGWVCNEDNSHLHMDVDTMPFDGETDDL